MRLFFGLQPSRQESLDIAAWRDRVFPPLDRPVPVANLHITLAFLGNVAEEKLELLGQAVDDIPTSPFSVILDELGYWSKPRILWLGTETTPGALKELVRHIKRAGRSAGIPIEKRKYQPHVTLARNCKTPPPASVEPPAFKIEFDRFLLFESVNVKGGVRYDPVAEWRL
jgi:2'-5' RNA ligase